jgi:Na+/melibiose symporter-like transporter
VLGTTDAVIAAVVAYLVIMSSASAMQAAQQTLIPEHAAAARRGRAASLKTAFDIGGAFLAFLVLGWSMETGGLGAAVVTIGLVLLVAMVLVKIWVPSESTERGAIDAGPGPGPIAWPAGFWQLVAARFLFLFGVYVTGRFLLLLLAERLGIPASSAAGETGLLLAAFTLTTALTALLSGPLVDRVGRARIAVIGGLIAAIGVALFVPPLGLPGALLAGTVLSVGTALFVTANWAALTDVSPPEEAGRLLAFANFGTGGAAACAGLAGPMIDAWGFTPVLLLAMVVMLTALVAIPRPLPGTHLEATT